MYWKKHRLNKDIETTFLCPYRIIMSHGWFSFHFVQTFTEVKAREHICLHFHPSTILTEHHQGQIELA